ncbi:MAG: hypothetical protein ACREX4_14670, partial [Gammaproteobacteria bacterium]
PTQTNKSRPDPLPALQLAERELSHVKLSGAAPSNSRSSGTAALRLRLRPYDSAGKLRFLPSSRGEFANSGEGRGSAY